MEETNYHEGEKNPFIKNYPDEESPKEDIISKEKLSNKHGMPFLQTIIDEIGLTYFHYLLTLTFAFLYFIYGCQVYQLNFIYPVLDITLYLTKVTRSILTSIYFLGDVLGSILSGLISRKFNRKYPILIISVILLSFSFMLLIFTNYYWMLFCRFVCGFCIGALTCLSVPIVSEYSPTKYREHLFTAIFISYRFGIIIYVICYHFIIENATLNNWKHSITIAASPITIYFLLNLFITKESPRYMFSKKLYDDAIKYVNFILDKRNKQLDGSQDIILREEADIYHEHNKEEVKYMELFSQKYRKLTMHSMIIIFCSSLCSIGNMYSLPLIETTSDPKLWISVVWQQSIAVVAILIGAFLAFNPNIGRAKTMFIGFFMTSIMSFICLCLQKRLDIFSSIMNFSIVLSFFIIKIYVVEAYPTKLRDIAIASCFFVGRMGDLICVPLCDIFHSFFNYGPVLLIMLLSMLGSFSALMLPFETSKVPLDFDH